MTAYVHVIARAVIATPDLRLEENEPGILPRDVAEAFGANVQILGPADDPRKPKPRDTDDTEEIVVERALESAPHDRMQRQSKNRSL